MSLVSFRARDAAEKMREHALRHDYEGAIPFRDTWRELTAQLAAEEAAALVEVADRKVICLTSRAPVPSDDERAAYKVIDLVTPEGIEAHDAETAAPVEPFVADEEETSLLAFIADEVNHGRLSGLMILGGHREDDGTISVVSQWTTMPVIDAGQSFLGALAECKHDLLQVMDEAYELDAEDVNSED